MTVLIITVVILFTLMLGGLLAVMFAGFGKSVQQNELAISAAGKSQASRFNPAMTMGFDIAYKEDAATQIKDARILSAKQAAAQPRGANTNIGSLGNPTFVPIAKSLESDPWTASKIAQHHGWDGARSGFVRGVAAAPAAGGAAAVTIAPPVLIELTDDMEPGAKRSARIANAKAKSAYKKALKAAGIDPKAAAAAPAAGAAPVAAAPVAADPVAAAGIEPPVLIELTDDMDPADKRAARIANSKAKSAYKKALKAAGIDPKAAAAPAPVAATPAPVAPAAPAANPAAAAGIEPPVLIELTDDMDPADKRDARIANSKAKSAYKKALKAAGIDPKSVA